MILFLLMCLAGLSCCVAMAMPQVHIVAYCGDLGYGIARGAEMLSLMLGLGIFSRIGSGFLADRIGGVPTLLLGSALQRGLVRSFLAILTCAVGLYLKMSVEEEFMVQRFGEAYLRYRRNVSGLVPFLF